MILEEEIKQERDKYLKGPYYLMSPEDYIDGIEVYVNYALSHEVEYVKEVLSMQEGFNGTHIGDFLNMLKDGYGEAFIKYLDQKDIESLGFINPIDDRDGRNVLVYSSACDNYRLYDYRYYSENMEDIIKIVKCNAKYHDSCFTGIIKNKSELKRILRQLQII